MERPGNRVGRANGCPGGAQYRDTRGGAAERKPKVRRKAPGEQGGTRYGVWGGPPDGKAGGRYGMWEATRRGRAVMAAQPRVAETRRLSGFAR